MKTLVPGMLLCLVGCAWAWAQKPAEPKEFFPFRQGTTWVYQGTVRWEEPEEEKPGTAEVTWKMTVERVIRKKGVVAAVVTGYPADLDWTGGTTEPKPWLILEDANHRVFYENLGPEFDLAKLNGDEHVFEKFMVEENLFFQWPLRQGAKFCGEEAMKREDGMYCWVVTEVNSKSLKPVKGAPEGERSVFRAQYRTNPDDTTVELVPGVGVVSYAYHHHGTVADTELHLVEFHPAPEGS